MLSHICPYTSFCRWETQTKCQTWCNNCDVYKFRGDLTLQRFKKSLKL
jgi:hypothetical protein